MSSNKIDVRILQAAQFGEIGSKKYQVQANATQIYPGEPVLFNSATQYVTQMGTNKPVVGTDYLVGIAETASNETASADGIVYVRPIVSGAIYGITPKVAITSQTTYDGYVGKTVLMDLTTGTFTGLVANSVNNGLIVENLNIKETPSTLAFKFRNKVRYENI